MYMETGPGSGRMWLDRWCGRFFDRSGFSGGKSLVVFRDRPTSPGVWVGRAVLKCRQSGDPVGFSEPFIKLLDHRAVPAPDVPGDLGFGVDGAPAHIASDVFPGRSAQGGVPSPAGRQRIARGSRQRPRPSLWPRCGRGHR